MNKRKIFILLLSLVTSVSTLTGTVATASASPINKSVKGGNVAFYEVINVENVFAQSYIAVENLNHDNGGYISIDNYASYIEASAPGLDVAETLSETAKDGIEGYAYKFETLLNAYKKASIAKLDTFYDENEYSHTENGIVAINSLKSLVVTEINNASWKSEIDVIVSDFETQIETGGFSKKSNYVQTPSDADYIATVYYGAPAFSDDAVFEVKKVKDEILVKNTQLALLDNENTIENGGVALYLNFIVKEDGVINETVYDENLTIAISVESAGLTIENDAVVQIAKYSRNLNVELISAQVLDGYIVFNANTLGEYAIVLSGYELENRSEFVAFFEKYWGIVVAGVVVILVIAIPIISAKKERKKREQQEYKEFKKNQKQKHKKEKEEKAKAKRKRKQK